MINKKPNLYGYMFVKEKKKKKKYYTKMKIRKT